MRPEDWDRMSWAARLSYLRNLTAYETELRRREQAIGQTINHLRHGGGETKGPNPIWTMHEAKQIYRLIPKDSQQEITQRQRELEQL
jgi:hypothetical protein